MAIKLTAELVEAFAGTFLSPLYDNPQPTPDFHREVWKLYCTDDPFCAIAAPRGHAKSSAFTHAFVLAVTLFRIQDYIVIVSATEDLAIGHLHDIAKEFRENDDIRHHFGVQSMPVDAKTEIVVKFNDGHQIKIKTKGAGQKMRGMKWDGKRPGLIVCDDLEDDSQIENKDIRESFSRWFNRALIPCKRKGGVVRVHGTIMHEDSLLSKLLKSKSWKTRKFKAHKAFDDFTDILWPEQFEEKDLRLIRQNYIDAGDPGGYSQEYLNDPRDNSEAYLRKQDFIAMEDGHYDLPKLYRVGCDFAVSKESRRDYTSFTIGGMDSYNTIHIVDQYKGRWDPTEWLDVMFDIEERYHPEEFLVEGGAIWKAIEPTIYNEMRKRNIFMNIRAILSTKDKGTRARPFQKRHRGGGMRFDKKAEWYSGYEDELLRFTMERGGTHDDQFDSTSILVRGFEDAAEVEQEDFRDEEEWSLYHDDPRDFTGRSAVTGY